MMESGRSYIQKNPLFGRKVIRFDRIRESVWDWQLCDATIVTLDKDPGIVHVQRAASSIYDHQGLTEIPTSLFHKIHNLVKLYETACKVVDAQRQVVLRQETLGQVIGLLTDVGIIDDTTYDAAHLRTYAEEYDRYSRQQMEHVTDVIDVHK